MVLCVQYGLRDTALRKSQMCFPSVAYVDLSTAKEEGADRRRRELQYILITESRKGQQINKDKQRSNRSFGIWARV